MYDYPHVSSHYLYDEYYRIIIRSIVIVGIIRIIMHYVHYHHADYP